MVRQYTALTKQIDYPESALQEILEQLNPKENMLKNTVGIIHFHHYFVKNDTWKLFTDALPFELTGCASSYIGAGGQHSDFAISITMLTSDDCHFAVRTLDNLESKTRYEINRKLQALYKEELCTKEKPKMIIPFLPPIPNYSINNFYFAMNDLDPSVPLFGMQAFNIADSQDTNFILGNNKMSFSMCALTAVYGNIDPEFHIGTSFNDDKIIGDEAIITEADGPVLKKVNDISALTFFKSRWLITSDDMGTSIMAIPARITYLNGGKVGCAFLGTIKDTDHIFAARTLEEGAKINFTYLEKDDILASAETVMREITEKKRNDIFICISAARAWSLGSNFFAEMQLISKIAKEYEKENVEPLRYSVVYTGSELCPIRRSENDKESFMNMPHNYTFAACSFNHL